MSSWKAILFFSLLVLAVLIQVVVFRWGSEAVFFVTWSLVMLVVKHDTRLSPALGLVFLATCPFLLIADKEPVAEQAANYAYFFLAIGVLVQVEEMVLERNDRLGWKLDISFLWRGASEKLSTSTEMIPDGTKTNLRMTNTLRWILIVGIGGFILIYFVAALTGVPQTILLPLLGGAILFLFLVWGLRLALVALGQIRLSQITWVLVLLPFVVMAGIWINELIGAYQVARMDIAYNFVNQLGDTNRTLPAPEGEVVEAQVWTIGNESQQVLYQHPAYTGASRITFPLHIEPGARLAFDAATAPESWERPGDGVDFSIYVDSGKGLQQVFSSYIDPKNDEFERRWHPHTVDLEEFTGQEVTLIFETGPGPTDDYRYDWAGWGNLRLLEP